MAGNRRYVLAIDLGGTKIYSAVIDRKGKIVGLARKRTKGELGFEAVVTRLLECAHEALQDAKVSLADIKAVGIGSPGPLDLKNGVIIETPNLGWQNAPLKARVEDGLKKSVSIDNDGNLGILGEYAYGAGEGAQHMVGLFIGTGIGGGVIVNGKVLHGFNENAAELGHMILDPDGPVCGCGRKGCLEAFASRLAIEREIRSAVHQGTQTLLFEGDADLNARIRSKKLAAAFSAGDKVVQAAVIKSATYVGYGVANLLNIFNPEVVVIGGGVIEALGENYIKIVQETAASNVFPIAIRNVRITAAKLKDDSTLLGAAVLAWNSLSKKRSKSLVIK